MTVLLNGFSIIASFSWWTLPCPWCVASPPGTMLRLAGWSGSSWSSWISSLAWFLIAGRSKRLWKEGNHKCSWRWFVTLCRESFSHGDTEEKLFFSSPCLCASVAIFFHGKDTETQRFFRACPGDKKGFLCALVSLWFNAFCDPLTGGNEANVQEIGTTYTTDPLRHSL